MNSSSNTISAITPRELRRLRVFQRSRELYKSRDNLKITSEGKGEFVFIVFGSGDAVSAKHRRILREHIAQLLDSKLQQKVSISFSLFSNILSQKQNKFTNLRSVSSLLQGSSFKRVIYFKEANSLDETFIQRQSMLKRISTFRVEGIQYFPVKPVIVFSPVHQGAFSPRRANQFTLVQPKIATALNGHMECASLIAGPSQNRTNLISVAKFTNKILSPIHHQIFSRIWLLTQRNQKRN